MDHRLDRVDPRSLELGRLDLSGTSTGGGAREVVVTELRRVLQREHAQCGARDGAIGTDLDRPAILGQHVVTELIHKDPLVVLRELPVTGVLNTTCGLHRKETRSGNPEVERIASRLKWSLSQIGGPLLHVHAGVNGANYLPVGGVVEQQRTKALLHRGGRFVPGGRRVRQSLASWSFLHLFGEHARRGDIQAQIPCDQISRRGGGFLERTPHVGQTHNEMEPLAVDLNLLRAVLTPDLQIDVGKLLMVRIASVESSGRGMLSLAGMLLEAELPEGVSTGQELKLVVREITPEKVVLSIQNDPQAAIPLLSAALIPLAAGSLEVRERGGGRSTKRADGSHSLKLRYDAPNFGALDMHFVLDPQGGLQLAVVVPVGDALNDAQAAAPRLQQNLVEATNRSVILSVAGRYEPLEVFA